MTVINKTWTEADIICNALGERTVRDGAEWLNEKLPETYQITHATVHNWVNGVHAPMSVTLQALQMFYTPEDARHQLAADLAAHRIRQIEKDMRAHWAGGAK